MSKKLFDRFQQLPRKVSSLLPSAPESRELLFIDVAVAAVIAGVPIGAFLLMLI